MSFRFVALCVTVAAAPALAEDTSVGRQIRLDCPAGTVQKGGKVTKDMGVFCIKADGKAQIRMGDTARVSFDPKAAHYFGADGMRVPLYDTVAA